MNKCPALGQQFCRNRFGPQLYAYLRSPGLEYFPGMVHKGRLEVRPPEVGSDIGDLFDFFHDPVICRLAVIGNRDPPRGAQRSAWAAPAGVMPALDLFGYLDKN